VFAELPGTATVWRKALKAWNMRESPQVLEWQAEARLETLADYLRRAIRIRFGIPVPADLEDQLTAIKKEAELDRWFDASLTAPTIDAFRAAVQNGRRKRKKSK
jgi:hypothetical protein